jgi:hypothetical protein
MNGYFSRVVGLLKRNNYFFLGKGSGKYEVWRKFSHDVIVPNQCASHHTANGVLKAAGIHFSFSENCDESDMSYRNYMISMEKKDSVDWVAY